MKRFFSFLLLASAIVSCNNAPIEPDPDEAKKDSAARNQNTSLPYNVPNQPDWERGNAENVAIAMKALKAYETNDMSNVQQLFTDSVEFYADNISFEGSRDSLIQLMKTFRDRYSNISVNMLDYESVKSKKRNEEWVGLWYVETQTLKNNKVDSVFIMDDFKIVDGKVAEIDSKYRRIPAKK